MRHTIEGSEEMNRNGHTVVRAGYSIVPWTAALCLVLAGSGVAQDTGWQDHWPTGVRGPRAACVQTQVRRGHCGNSDGIVIGKRNTCPEDVRVVSIVEGADGRLSDGLTTLSAQRTSYHLGASACHGTGRWLMLACDRSDVECKPEVLLPRPPDSR